MKQCKANPWDDFAASMKKGDKVRGQIKSITDFGIFIGLQGGIDGLVHLSDLSWSQAGEEAIRNFKKGDEVEAVILSIDVEKERISLGVKQLTNDPVASSNVDKGAVVKGTVKSLDAKGAVIDLGGELEGYLRASEASRDRVEDIRSVLKEGDEIEAKVISTDRKTRTVNLSIRAKDMDDEADAVQKYSNDSGNAGTTNLGALLKAKMDGKNNE
jgi:small subunit ribosomal protein S1